MKEMTVLSPSRAFSSTPSFCNFTSHKLAFGSPKLHFPYVRPGRLPDSVTCCYRGSPDSAPSPSSDNSSSSWKWGSAVRNAVKSAIRRFDSYVNSKTGLAEDAAGVSARERDLAHNDDDWDWERWKIHFAEIDEQEHIISTLKTQLNDAVDREDYEDAARLKVATAAAAAGDTVGRVIHDLKRAIKDERYEDAAFIQDCACTSLIGWWAGVADDDSDPYGRIIRISAEHGKYVARSYNPWQLSLPLPATGIPLFEIYLNKNARGEYKQQVVYLNRTRAFQDSHTVSKSSLSSDDAMSSNHLGSIEGKSDIIPSAKGDGEDLEDDFDIVSALSSFQNILRDIIPGVKVKVLKVTTLGKVDRDLIHKVLKRIIVEADGEKDVKLDGLDGRDETGSESDGYQTGDEMYADRGSFDHDEKNELAVKVFVGGFVHRSSGRHAKSMERLPAQLITSGRSCFSFSLEQSEKLLLDKDTKRPSKQNVNRVIFGLAKFIGKEKLPLKVIKEIGELLNLTLNQARSHRNLSGTTFFNRIDTPSSSDPLSGLYIGANGHYASELIHMRRQFGQWEEDDDDETSEESDLEFYEYVEALKITGDQYIPAGQVAFRAKIGKENQLPHKGIIPEEFGVIARYRAQGMLADRGFENPRWVDGELVVLDGKHMKGDPLVGFVCWEPEHHLMVFFNRVNLQE